MKKTPFLPLLLYQRSASDVCRRRSLGIESEDYGVFALSFLGYFQYAILHFGVNIDDLVNL